MKIITRICKAAIVIATVIIGYGPTASAAENSTDSSRFLISSSSSQTPFQKLEALFNAPTTKPMQVNQFPTPESKELKYWQCSTYVTSESSLSDLAISNSIPVIVSAVTQTVPGFEGAGPEFPAIAAHNLSVLMVDFITADNTAKLNPIDLGVRYLSYGYEMTTYPGVSQTALTSPDDPDSKYKLTFRWHDGMIVVKLSQDSSPDMYSYCWKSSEYKRR